MENPFPADPQHTAHNEPHPVSEPKLSQPSESGAHASELTPSRSTEDAHAESQNADTVATAHKDSNLEAHAPENPTFENRQPDVQEEPSLEATPAGDQHEASDAHAREEKPSQNSPEHVEAHAHETGSLEDFAARALRGRLNSDEESEAAVVLKEALLGGRTDVAKAVAATPSLPWIVSVQATAGAWPEMKPSFRSQFLAGLARTQGEQAARIRLSLARGLFKVDQAAALKLILLTLKLLRNKETGLLEGKGPALFANVLIGRGKAWALQLPLQNLKPVEADLLVFAALHGAFHAPQAPIAQLSILKWAAAADRLTRLPEALEALILKGIGRWSGKWQGALRKEVTPIPESWAQSLKDPSAKQPQPKNRNSAEPAEKTDAGETPEDEQSGDEEIKRGHASGEHEDDAHRETEDSGNEDIDHDDDEDEDDDESEDQEAEEKPSRQKQRPVYVSKTVPNHGQANQPQHAGRRGGGQAQFNLQDTLRQIDNYVAGLRNELASTQKQLRQREDDPRRGRRNERPAPVVVPGELSTEELLRLNQQLESRNAELKARIDELTIDSEERAASSGLTTDSEPPDASTQLRTLLGFKLRDDYEDFLALQQEARDLVVQQHYRTVLQHVFEVLVGEGIHFPPSETEKNA